MHEKIKATGTLIITVYDKDGAVIDEHRLTNLVVKTGLEFIAARMTPTPPTAMTHMAVGTGTVPPSYGNSTLSAEIGTRAPVTTSNVSTTTTYSANFIAGNATGSLTEAAIFNAAVNGIMLCRTTFAPIPKSVTDVISISWTITLQ